MLREEGLFFANSSTFWVEDSREDESMRLANICKLKTLDVEPDQLDLLMNDAENEQMVIMKVRQG